MAGKNARQLLNREANHYWRFASAKAKKAQRKRGLTLGKQRAQGWGAKKKRAV
jgi:hypothetical protein